MHITARSYLTSGIAALGAGAIALSPIQPLPDDSTPARERAVSNLAVSLASTIDPITPWVTTIETTIANSKKVSDFYWSKPFPIIQTIAKNQATYLKELPDLGLIASQIGGNIKTFFEAPWSAGACGPCGDPPTYTGEYISDVPITNKIPIFGEKSQRFIFGLLPSLFSFIDPTLYPTIKPLLDLTAAPVSGQAAGGIGLLLSPVVQLGRSLAAMRQFIDAGDITGAINEIINIPANTTNATLNGAGYWDLTGIAGAVAPLPPQVVSVGLNLGGVFTPPVPLTGTVGAPTSVNGGVLFDILATVADAGFKVETPGLPVGQLSARIGLGQILGEKMLVVPPTATVNAPKVAAAAPAEAPAPLADLDVADLAPAAEAPAPADDDNSAPAHRGGASKSKSDNGGQSGGRNHRGAA